MLMVAGFVLMIALTLCTEIKTTLIPPTRSWPSWHLRIHEIEHTGEHTLRVLNVGFAISAETRAEVWVPDIDLKNISSREEASPDEGWYSDNISALVMSKHGASGVADF